MHDLHLDFGGFCDSDETDSSSDFESDGDDEEEENEVGVIAVPPKKTFKFIFFSTFF